MPVIVGYVYFNSLIGFPILGLFLGGILLHVFVLLLVNAASLYVAFRIKNTKTAGILLIVCGVRGLSGGHKRRRCLYRHHRYSAQEFGTVDVLVNNAGINGPEKKSPEITTKEWDEVLDINLKGCFMCSREAIKKMLRQKEDRDGTGDYSIINISSKHESTPMPLAAPYAASKGGMEMITKTLALEVADKGVRINSIAPGAIATMMNVDILEDEKKRKDEENKIPMHRIGEPNEIGKVALFLASDAASYITGTTIYVDGGLTLVT